MDKNNNMDDPGDLADYFEKTRFLADLIQMFWGLGQTIQEVLEDEAVDQVVANLLTKFDSSWAEEIEYNIFSEWNIVLVLLWTLPGKSCENIGTRVGIILRKLSGVGIEGLKDDLKMSGFDSMNEHYLTHQ